MSGDGGCQAGPVADGAVRSSAAGRLTVSEKSQGAVEVVVRELPDEVEATVGHRRVDFPYVFVVQLSQLLVLVHLTCLDLGEPAGGRVAVSSVHAHRPAATTRVADGHRAASTASAVTPDDEGQA